MTLSKIRDEDLKQILIDPILNFCFAIIQENFIQTISKKKLVFWSVKTEKNSKRLKASNHDFKVNIDNIFKSPVIKADSEMF